MRTIGAEKSGGSGAFHLAERSRHMEFSDCFITQNVSEIAKEYFHYDFPEVDGTVQPRPARETKKLRYNTRIKASTEERTEDHVSTEASIQDYLKTNFDDDVNVKFTGSNRGLDSYEVRGHRKHCPVCTDSHVNNGAFIRNIGGGFFDYRCMARPKDLFDFKIQQDTKPDTNKKYLDPFLHVKAKVISICAPMGSGKTKQIEDFIEHNYKDATIIFVTCRKGMARTLKGRLRNYDIYTDVINQQRQIHEYESLHKASRQMYDLVVIDEIRSMLSSSVCPETNGDNLSSNMAALQEICDNADQVICADADLYIDGSVSDFYKTLFRPTEIHHITHEGGQTPLHYLFADEARFTEMMKDDLRQGRKIVACVGSAAKLKALEKMAAEIIDPEKVVAYYAGCSKQNEISNVTRNWAKYNFIGFTSTITVSVDYQGAVYKVYIYPDSRTCTPREMEQMRARARWILSLLIVVMYNAKQDGALVPLNFDLDAAKNAEKNRILTRRRTITDYTHEVVKVLYASIARVGVGYRAKYLTNTLTEAWAWDRVEQNIKRDHWHQAFIAIITHKGHTYSRRPETCESYDDAVVVRKEIKAKMGEVKDEKEALLEEVSVEGMTRDSYYVLLDKLNKGNTSPEEVAMIEKYKVQQFYETTVSGGFVTGFKRNKRAIYTRAFMKAFPSVPLMKEIELQRIVMRDTVDDARKDVTIATCLLDTIKGLEFGELGDSKITVDMNDLSETKALKLEKSLQTIRDIRMERERGETPKRRFNHLLKVILGYKLKGCDRMVANKRSKVYYLVDIMEGEFLENDLFGQSWIDRHLVKLRSFERKNDCVGQFNTDALDPPQEVEEEGGGAEKRSSPWDTGGDNGGGGAKRPR